jgi:alcohol dehydrogenase class IV
VANGSDVLPATRLGIVADTGGPTGLRDFGYSAKDLPGLVDGALKQRRLLVCCPRDVTARDLERVIAGSMTL